VGIRIEELSLKKAMWREGVFNSRQGNSVQAEKPNRNPKIRKEKNGIRPKT
jgi:hypothetical protein